MAGTLTEDTGLDGVSGDQRCHSGESIAEWRSSEQVENGTPSTSPPYYDTDDDDCGPKPAELYGKFTWKIESFSQINKRELKSNAFDVGGYKWYILIYPQGCDVFNHLSLFLCVANHDKLLPGWSHFAQFTISVVNKDPKKTKYSDTLHRFWKKEHDWGWKKFMELSKLNDGFVIDDVLIIKAQVQVIREKADRPFRCLDVQYRRELVRVYLSNIDQICRRFIDDRRMKLSRLIDDKVRWSSFRAFWLGIDPITKRVMSRERAGTVLKVLVKHFFLEKEVTSTLVMDAMYGGLKSLECQSKNKVVSRTDEIILSYSPMVYVDQDHFVLSNDVVFLLEKAVSDTWPQQSVSSKDDKGSQNRSKLEGNSGEEASNNPFDRDNRRLTELGRRTVEFFTLIQIFSRIEVMYQEAVALRRQEELIREEEAAGLIENGKREKRAKKKQSKQKKNGRKGKDKGKNKEAVIIDVMNEMPSKQEETTTIIIEAEEATSDASDNASETALQIDLDYRDSSPVNWETDASEAPQMGASGREMLTGGKNRKESSVVDDSSSTCSTESCNGKLQGSSNRGRKQQNKNKKSQENAENISSNLEDDSLAESSCNTSVNVRPTQEAVINSVTDWVESHITDKAEETVTEQAKPKLERKSEMKIKSILKTVNSSPSLSPLSIKKQPSVSATHPPKLPSEISPTVSTATTKATQAAVTKTDQSLPYPSKSEAHKPSIIIPLKNNTAPQSRPSIAPTKSTVSVPVLPVVSTVPSIPVLSRSASSAGRSTNEASPSIPTFVPTSYRNAMMGTNGTSDSAGSVGTNKLTSPALELSTTSSPSMFPPLERKEESFQKQGLSFAGPSSSIGTEFERWRASRYPSSEIPQTSTSGSVSDEFPHLDIINDLLDEDKCFGARGAARVPQNRTRNFARQYSMPENNRYESNYVSSSFGANTTSHTRHFSHVDLMAYSNGYMDDVAQNHWPPYGHADFNMGDLNGYVYQMGDYDYNSMISGVNGFNHPMYRPSNGY